MVNFASPDSLNPQDPLYLSSAHALFNPTSSESFDGSFDGQRSYQRPSSMLTRMKQDEGLYSSQARLASDKSTALKIGSDREPDLWLRANRVYPLNRIHSASSSAPASDSPPDSPIDWALTVNLESDDTLTGFTEVQPLTGDPVLEVNDTLTQATQTRLTSDYPGSVILSGAVGDNPDFAAELDVDFFNVQMKAGDRLVVDIDARIYGSSLDSLVTVFDASGNVLAFSDDAAAPGESFTFDSYLEYEAIATGNYYVGVSGYGNVDYDPFISGSGDPGSTGDYTLNLALESVANNGLFTGSLGADTFTHSLGTEFAVYSGNGNIEFGDGEYDRLNFSNISSSDVSFNLATLSGGGVVYDPGNGARLFDAITLDDGSQILFEGLDRLVFSDSYVDLTVTPNDPLFSDQWNLHMMGVHNAWRLTTGTDDVLIGVQDSGLGVDSNGSIHPDLKGSETWLFPNNYVDELAVGRTSHGTAVQGIIAAASNNGYGMSGINWSSDVFNIDVIPGANFETGDRDLADATQAMIDFAQQNGQQLVINMSLGLSNSFGQVGLDPEFEALIADNPDNVLFVIASGNDDVSSMIYPSTLANLYDNVIAVGASWGDSNWYGDPTEPGDRISYLGWWGSNYGDGLTLMGPSEVISTEALALSFGTEFDFHLNGPAGPSHVPFNGTSAATPNVTGVASLVWSANPNLTAVQVQEILSETSYDLGTPGYDAEYGHGFVNADAAVRRALAMAIA